MAKTVYYSKTNNRGSAVAAAQRSFKKMGLPLVLVGLALALAAVLLVPLMVGGATPTASGSSGLTAENVVEMPGLKQAAAALGIEPKLPTALPEGYALTSCRVVNNQWMEAEITNSKQTFVLRITGGSADLSGQDYETTPYTAVETVGGISLGYAGVSEKKLSTAVWVDGDCSYALVAVSGAEAGLMRQMAETLC